MCSVFSVTDFWLSLVGRWVSRWCFWWAVSLLGILRISAEIEDQGLDEYYHIEEGTEFDKLESPFPKFMDKLFFLNS